MTDLVLPFAFRHEHKQPETVWLPLIPSLEQMWRCRLHPVDSNTSLTASQPVSPTLFVFVFAVVVVAKVSPNLIR